MIRKNPDTLQDGDANVPNTTQSVSRFNDQAKTKQTLYRFTIDSADRFWNT